METAYYFVESSSLDKNYTWDATVLAVSISLHIYNKYINYINTFLFLPIYIFVCCLCVIFMFIFMISIIYKKKKRNSFLLHNYMIKSIMVFKNIYSIDSFTDSIFYAWFIIFFYFFCFYGSNINPVSTLCQLAI